MGVSIRVASFNIRLGTANDGGDSWPNRIEQAAKAIRTMDVDVVGLQEAYQFQLNDLLPRLDDYTCLGVGREDGIAKGEYSALLVRKSRVSVGDWGTFWFSDRPDEPGSKAFDADCTRSCTWAHLKGEGLPSSLLACNLHWDHASEKARVFSAEMLAARIPADEPCIVTGDFNAGPETAEMARLMDPTRHPSLVDATPGVCLDGSWHAFKGTGQGPRIDHILVSNHFRVEASGALTSKIDGRWPSDHFPIWSEIVWR